MSIFYELYNVHVTKLENIMNVPYATIPSNLSDPSTISLKTNLRHQRKEMQE